MAKKELKNKIKIVGFWTFGGVFWYLVISFFLLSEYPIQEFIFDHKKAYEVLKDALTIAATFLAPVAAFVLFSDWRDQHRSITNEKVSRQIVNKLSDLLPFVSKSYIYLVNKGEIDKFSQSYFSYLIELARDTTSINSIDPKSQKFIQDMEIINSLLMNIWLSLERQIVLNQELSKISSFDERSEALRKSYIDKINQIDIEKSEFLETFLKKKTEIGILYV
ncbi:hypothetical protein QM281_15410 [Acinetobacter baumannii]|uniref:hypothetical protein n=1 Tax=Acinetobacter baumannii TaxID=470 RepID=UPI0012468F51|nr:hypothetical protein [Acinetobacter baumannii]KAB0455613.1 hypothetical protein EG248_05515 [Acinetobacter baumannii]MDC5559268.1 hypothetical protein [Acinetobacter baumannii]MDI9708504.1 hypothetical protein [Acinetobacter baumannii]